MNESLNIKQEVPQIQQNTGMSQDYCNELSFLWIILFNEDLKDNPEVKCQKICEKLKN